MRTFSPERFDPTITHSNYFPISPGTSWGPRVISDIELIYCVGGRFAYRDELGHGLTFGPGELLLISPDVGHTIGWKRGRQAKFACIHCEPVRHLRYAEGNYEITPAPRLLTSTGRDPLLRSLFEQTARAFAGGGLFRRELVSTLVKSIWLRLAEYWQPTLTDTPSLRIEQMAEFLRGRYRDPVGRLDLAERFQLTPQYVNALFKRELGVTPVDFLNQRRIDKAVGLLRDGASVKDAAEAVGFSDAFYFSKVFKRIRGVPPSEISGSQ